MSAGDASAETGHWSRGPAGTALWASAGALSFLLGWYISVGLDSLGLNPSWDTGGWLAPFGVSLSFLVCGLAYTGLLAFALHRAGLASWRRAASFAALAAPWFVVAFNTGLAVYDIADRIVDADSGVLEFIFAFLIWFGGLFAGGVWVALAGLALLPALRSRRSVVWLLSGGAVFALPAGAMAMVDFDAMLRAMQFAFAAWCAVHAAAFTVALRRAQCDAGDPARQSGNREKAGSLRSARDDGRTPMANS